MSIQGNQRILRVGSRMLFQRDPIAGAVQGWRDLGIIKTANPTRNQTTVDLYDGGEGVNTLIASEVTQVDETYSIVTNNFNPQNLALLFAANPPAAYTVTAGAVEATMVYGGPGTLLKLNNTSGAYVYDVSDILGFYVAADLQGTVTAMNASAGTITVTQDFSGLAASSHIIVATTGLAAAANAGTYKIASTSGNGPTTLTIDPSVRTISADESSVTGFCYGSTVAGAIFKYKTDWDKDAIGLRRGYAKILDGATVSLTGNVQGLYVAKAITGKRLILPQTVAGEIKGNLQLFWTGSNGTEEMVREGRASILPATPNFQLEQFSEMTYTVKLLTDLTQTQPSGRMIQTVGALPAGVV